MEVVPGISGNGPRSARRESREGPGLVPGARRCVLVNALVPTPVEYIEFFITLHSQFFFESALPVQLSRQVYAFLLLERES